MFDEVKVQLNNLNGRTRLLSSRLGQPGGEDDAQSLWEHIEETQRDLMDTQMVLHKTKHRANEFEKFEGSTETRLKNLEVKCKESGAMEDNVAELRNNHRLFVQKYQESVANMSPNVQVLNTKLKRKAPDSGPDISGYDVDKIRREVSEVERRSDTKMRTEIGDLKLWTLGIVNEKTDQGNTAAFSTANSSQPLPTSLAMDAASLGIGLAALSERVKDFLKGGSTGSGEY
jgi:chromosome segregation ATPase